MKSLKLLVLRCRNIDESRAFYECQGMKFFRHAHGKGPQHYAHEDEDGVFELYPTSGRAGDKTGLAFDCADLKAMFQTLQEKGYAPESIRETEWGMSFVVRDPDGRRVEIRETPLK